MVRIKWIILFWARLFSLSCAWEKRAFPQVEAFSAELVWLIFGIKDRRKTRLEGHTILMLRAHYEFPQYHDNILGCSLFTSQELLQLPPADFCHYLAPSWFQHITIHTTSKAFFLGNSSYRNHHSTEVQITPPCIHFHHFTCHFQVFHFPRSPESVTNLRVNDLLKPATSPHSAFQAVCAPATQHMPHWRSSW